MVTRTEELFLDWIGCTLAGRNSRPTRIMEELASQMGPPSGPSQVMVSREYTSPYFATLINAAAAHVVEQDDIHHSPFSHPAAAVFPAVLAAAQETGASGRDVIVASVAGHEAGVRMGEFLARSRHKALPAAGTLAAAAAVAVARLLGLDSQQTLYALGSAGTQAAGLWESRRDAIYFRQLHTAKAAADGLLATYLARAGFSGASRMLAEEDGPAASMAGDVDSSRLTNGLGNCWAVAGTSPNPDTGDRRIHPAADALLELMCQHGLKAEDIVHIQARVHQRALDFPEPIAESRRVPPAMTSMSAMLALIALYGRAGMVDFTPESLHDPAVRAYHKRVEIVQTEEGDLASPSRWIGQVVVETRDGDQIVRRIPVHQGNPTNALSRAELEEKALRLATCQGGATAEEMQRIIVRFRRLASEPDVRNLF